VDEGGDDETRADTQRGENLGEGRPAGKLSISLAIRWDHATFPTGSAPPYQPDTELVGFLTNRGTLEIEISGERLSLEAERSVTVLRAPLRPGRPRLQRALDE
jgi:hypothetical protein